MDTLTQAKASSEYASPWWLPSGSALTLAAAFWPRPLSPTNTVQHTIAVNDGDALLLHENVSPDWKPGDRTVLLVHGLAGCSESPYMVRLAQYLLQPSEPPTRVFRLNLRGAGGGELLARQHYHAARLDDLCAVASYVVYTLGSGRLFAVGFSLGGGMLLRWGAEPDCAALLKAIVTVSPPIDLAYCAQQLRSHWLRPYDRYFARVLWNRLLKRRAKRPDLAWVELKSAPRGLWEFDDSFTAPLAGFSSAEDYYAEASSKRKLDQINVPTFVVAADDDPVVPQGQWSDVAIRAPIEMLRTPRGGHVSYLNANGNRHWLPCRIAAWLRNLV